MIMQLFVYLAMIVLGLSVLAFIKSLNLAERVGLAFPLGSLFVTFSWFLLNWRFNILLNENTGIASIVLSCVAGGVSYLIFKPQLSMQSLLRFVRSAGKLETVLWIAIAILIGSTLLSNVVIPIHDWDALTLYDFRAQILAQSGSFDTDVIAKRYFLGYPPYTSLGHLVAYMFGSPAPKVWYTLIYTSLILTFYGLVKRFLPNQLAVLGAFFLAAQPSILGHAYMAYTNLPHMMFYALAVCYFFMWLHQNRSLDLVVFSLLLMGSSWVRFAEPFHLILMLLFIVSALIFKRSFWSLLSFIPVMVLRYIWVLYTSTITASHQAYTSSTGSSHTKIIQEILSELLNLERVVEVFSYVLEAVSPIYIHYIPIALVCLLLAIKSKQGVTIYIHLIFYAHFAFLFLGAFYFSINIEYWKEISGSLNRISLSFIPIVYFLILFSLSKPGRVFAGNKTSQHRKKKLRLTT